MHNKTRLVHQNNWFIGCALKTIYVSEPKYMMNKDQISNHKLNTSKETKGVQQVTFTSKLLDFVTFYSKHLIHIVSLAC